MSDGQSDVVVLELVWGWKDLGLDLDLQWKKKKRGKKNTRNWVWYPQTRNLETTMFQGGKGNTPNLGWTGTETGKTTLNLGEMGKTMCWDFGWGWGWNLGLGNLDVIFGSNDVCIVDRWVNLHFSNTQILDC